MSYSPDELASENNVASIFAHIAARIPDKTAMVFQRNGIPESITFSQLRDQAASVSSALIAAGLKRSDRVIIMIPMSIDLYVTLLAVIQTGAVAVFVDPWIPAKQIAAFADFAEPTAFIGIRKSHMLRLFRRNLRRLPITVTTGRSLFGIPAKYSLGRFKSHRPPADIAAVRASDSALITFTSGSSGEPKGANRTHRFLAAQHDALSHEFPWMESDVDMPMFPIFALNNLVSGLTSIVPEMDFRKVAEVNGAVIARQMLDNHVTTVTASPPLLDRLCQHVVEANGPVPELRRILTGGAPVTDEQLSSWIGCFSQTEILIAYGSTEAEPVGHIDARQRIAIAGNYPGYCTGKASSLIETRIIPIADLPPDLRDQDLDAICLPVGKTGELIVAGDHVCRDYYNNESATRENKIIDSTGRLWHRMGDTGYFDEEGRFWLAGRVHSTIRQNGKLIHPQLVEQAARRQWSAIEQVAAMGYDSESGAHLVAVVIFSSEPMTNRVKDFIKQALEKAGYPCDRIIQSKVRLPVDPRHNSKIDYTRLRQLPGIMEALR